MEEVSKLQIGAVETCSEFGAIKAQVVEVASSQAKTQQLLGELTVLVHRHMEPGNLDHDTLAKLWSTQPGTIFKWAGVLIVAFVILDQTGALARIGTMLSGLHP